MCHTNLLKYTCKHARVVRRSTCRGTFTRVRRSRRSPASDQATAVPAEPLRAFCQSIPTLVLHDQQECGDCQRKAANVELEKDIELVRLAYASLPSSLEDAEESGGWGLWLTDGYTDPFAALASASAPARAPAPASAFPPPGESLEEMEARISTTAWLITRQYPSIPQSVSSELQPPRPRPTTKPLGPTPLRNTIDAETLPNYLSPVVVGMDKVGWGGTWDWCGTGLKTRMEELEGTKAAKPKEIQTPRADMARCYQAWNEEGGGEVVAAPGKSWGSGDWDCLESDRGGGGETRANVQGSSEEGGCAWQDVQDVAEACEEADASDAFAGAVKPLSLPSILRHVSVSLTMT